MELFKKAFTGLFDKNGKKIHEGDKVRWQNGRIDTVIFKNGSFMLTNGNETSEVILGEIGMYRGSNATIELIN